jgi:polysaccharide export outer membrane protein
VKNMHAWIATGLAACLLGTSASQLVLAQAGAPVQPPATSQQKPAAPGTPPPGQPKPSTPAPPVAPPTQATPLPTGYVIGPDDVLIVSYWRNADMSAEVTVRPDGLISLPLLNEVKADGLTPEQLRDTIAKAATKFLEEAPAYYQLTGAMTVVQLLATAGGVQEFADSKNISIVRSEGGKQVQYRFNYKDFVKGKNLNQNILLKPGDTIVVP